MIPTEINELEQAPNELVNLDNVVINNSDNFHMYSNKLGCEGIALVQKNSLLEAVQCFTNGLFYNPIDHRHYLNRCYCFLRLSKNELALSDAEYVLKFNRNDHFQFFAKLRAGQALFALEQYPLAENYLLEALQIYPKNAYVKRELMRVKIKRIILSGFEEKDALIVLEQNLNTLEAIQYLSVVTLKPLYGKFINDKGDKDNFQNENYDLSNSYYSSDEEDEQSNFEELNRIIDYKPGELDFQFVKNTNSKDQSSIINLKINPCSIWVGNLNDRITENDLINIFSQFGTVLSSYIPIHAAYGFVNFANYKDVEKILQQSFYIVCGTQVIVKAAKKFL